MNTNLVRVALGKLLLASPNGFQRGEGGVLAPLQETNEWPSGCAPRSVRSELVQEQYTVTLTLTPFREVSKRARCKIV